MNHGGVPWLLAPFVMSGKDVILVTDVTEDDLKLFSYEPPTVQGETPKKIANGVFRFSSSATLRLWPVSRGLHKLPSSVEPFAVVMDPTPTVLTPHVAQLATTVSYRVRRVGAHPNSPDRPGVHCMVKVMIANSDIGIASKTHVSLDAADVMVFTLPYVLGMATGLLLESKVGNWAAIPTPETVVLHDALGRRTIMENVMPTAKITSMGRVFALCPNVSHEIRFFEVL